MAKILIEIEVKNLEEDYKDFLKDYEDGEEKPTLIEFTELEFDEFVSKVFGKIDNNVFFSGGKTKFSFKDKKICDELNKIWKLAKNENVNLVCFCKPKDCHGDIIKKLIESKL